MKILFKVIIISLVALSSLTADAYRIEFKKTLDSNAEENFLPNLILPINWNSSFYSSLEYRSGVSSDEKKVTNYDDSANKEEIKQSRIKLNAINYKISKDDYSYSLGIGASYETFDKTQKGYLVANGNRSDFDNSVDIAILSMYLKIDGIYKTDYLDLKLYGLVVPLSNLEVSQSTIFTGAVSKNLSAKSSASQSINYELDLEMTTKLNSFVDFNFNAKYRFLPLDYTLDTLSGAKDKNIEENISLLSARILFNLDVLDGWMPTIGYSRELTNSKDISDDSVIKLEEKVVYIGLNTRF